MLRCLDKPYTSDVLDIHVIAINASPLERGHCIVMPSMNKFLPQILNDTGVRIATALMLLVEDEHFHILYNSLLGHASVNHLHLHTLFWPYHSDLINKYVELLSQCSAEVYIIRRPEWFIQTFVFQLPSPDGLEKFILNISKSVDFLISQNVAHNLFMARAPPLKLSSNEQTNNANEQPLFVTAYLFPRRSRTGVKPQSGFNPASVELAGLITSSTWRFFESVTERSALRIFDDEAILSDGLFDTLCEGLASFLE